MRVYGHNGASGKVFEGVGHVQKSTMRVGSQRVFWFLTVAVDLSFIPDSDIDIAGVTCCGEAISALDVIYTRIEANDPKNKMLDEQDGGRILIFTAMLVQVSSCPRLICMTLSWCQQVQVQVPSVARALGYIQQHKFCFIECVNCPHERALTM